MPTQVVDIDLTAEIAALPEPTFTDVAVIGTSDTAPPGDAEFGEVNLYTDSDTVAEDYGDGSAVHTASDAVEEEGAEEWYVLQLEEVEHANETIADGGSIANTPALGEPGVTATNRDVVYVTESPPATPDAGEVAINTDTGEVATDDGTDAELTYYTADWTRLDRLEDNGVDRTHMADRQAGREHIGTYDELASWASGNRAGLILPTKDGDTYATEDDARTAANEIAGYVPSGEVLAIAHKSPDDVGGHILGQLATNEPYFDPFYDGDGYGLTTDYYEDALVGDPGTTGTFEGGDQNGDGPVNVLINVGGTTVLSNSLSTAGASSSYQYFDVRMTEIYAAGLVEDALTSLRLREDRVPFTEDGRTMISSAIKDALSTEAGGADDPFASIDVHVPSRDSLSDDDVANRIWSGITIDGVLSGNVHEFSLELTVSV